MSDDYSEDDRPEPWEKQPWETSQAFYGFTTYLNAKPRKVAVAYRSHLDAQGKKHNANTPAPSHWLQWSQGKDNKGRRIHGSIPWRDRAQAYDQWLQRRIAEQRIKRGNNVVIKWENITNLLLAKVEEVIQIYDPTKEQVDLLTLINSLEKFHRLSATIFGFQPPITLEVGAIGDAARSAAGGMTTADRLQSMAQIFSRAVTRKDEANAADIADTLSNLNEMLQGLRGDDEDEADT